VMKALITQSDHQKIL